MEKKSRQRQLTKEDRLLADKIRQIRDEKGLTQRELAERIGAHYFYITAVETHKRGVSLRMVYRIAKSLGVRVKDLFDF